MIACVHIDYHEMDIYEYRDFFLGFLIPGLYIAVAGAAEALDPAIGRLRKWQIILRDYK